MHDTEFRFLVLCILFVIFSDFYITLANLFPNVCDKGMDYFILHVSTARISFMVKINTRCFECEKDPQTTLTSFHDLK